VPFPILSCDASDCFAVEERPCRAALGSTSDAGFSPCVGFWLRKTFLYGDEDAQTDVRS